VENENGWRTSLLSEMALNHQMRNLPDEATGDVCEANP